MPTKPAGTIKDKQKLDKPKTAEQNANKKD
jgi:hypothetical protein